MPSSAQARHRVAISSSSSTRSRAFSTPGISTPWTGDAVITSRATSQLKNLESDAERAIGHDRPIDRDRFDQRDHVAPPDLVHRALSPFRQHEAPQCAVVESQGGRPDLRSVQRDELLDQRLDRVGVLLRLVGGPRGASLGGGIDSLLQREPRVGGGLACLGQAKCCATAERELGGPAVVTIPDRPALGARRLHDEVESVGAAVGNLVADELAVAV